MKVSIVSFNPVHSDYFQVHKLNCRDAQKAGRQGHTVYVAQGSDVSAIVDAEVRGLLDMDFDADFFRIMPCVGQERG